MVMVDKVCEEEVIEDDLSLNPHGWVMYSRYPGPFKRTAVDSVSLSVGGFFNETSANNNERLAVLPVLANFLLR